jgi:hypothetical protein
MNEIEFNIKALQSIKTTGLKIKWQRPTLPLLRSTIGVTRLNFSVRNGKRWPPCTIATLNYSTKRNTHIVSSGGDFSIIFPLIQKYQPNYGP